MAKAITLGNLAERDATRIGLLFIGCLLVSFWFIGQGLTIDNYQFFSHAAAEDSGDCLCSGGDLGFVMVFRPDQ